MTGLQDFRVENEKVVFLAFADGTQRRVAPSELSSHLGAQDLARVKDAMKLRTHFIRKVLPPTAMFSLLAIITALGLYDVYHINGFSSPPAAHQINPTPAPAWLPALLPQQTAAPASKPEFKIVLTAPTVQPTAVTETATTTTPAPVAATSSVPASKQSVKTAPVSSTSRVVQQTVVTPVQTIVQTVTTPILNLLTPGGLGH